MNDYEAMIRMLDKSKQPYYSYVQIGELGSEVVLMLADRNFSGIVPMLCFDLDTKQLVSTGVRAVDP